MPSAPLPSNWPRPASSESRREARLLVALALDVEPGIVVGYPERPIEAAARPRLAALVGAARGARALCASRRAAPVLEPRFRALARYARSATGQRDVGGGGARPVDGPRRTAAPSRFRHRQRLPSPGAVIASCRTPSVSASTSFPGRRESRDAMPQRSVSASARCSPWAAGAKQFPAKPMLSSPTLPI